MTQPVIDTLRLADRLKESGFQDMQAEGLARALGGEFADRIVTKADLDTGIKLVRADYRALDEKLDTRIGALDQKTDALDQKFDARLDALDRKFDARFDSLGRQITFMFAALAALLALGLIDTAQRLLG